MNNASESESSYWQTLDLVHLDDLQVGTTRMLLTPPTTDSGQRVVWIVSMLQELLPHHGQRLRTAIAPFYSPTTIMARLAINAHACV